MTAHCLVVARDRPGCGDLRAANRQAHLAHAAAHISGIRAAGPILDEDGQPVGSMFVVAMTAADARAMMDADPYVQAGLFETIVIDPVALLVGRSGDATDGD